MSKEYIDLEGDESELSSLIEILDQRTETGRLAQTGEAGLLGDCDALGQQGWIEVNWGNSFVGVACLSCCNRRKESPRYQQDYRVEPVYPDEQPFEWPGYRGPCLLSADLGSQGCIRFVGPEWPSELR